MIELKKTNAGWDDYRSNNLSGADKEDTQEWKLFYGQLGNPVDRGDLCFDAINLFFSFQNDPIKDGQHHLLLSLSCISNRDGTVVSHPGQLVSTGGEGYIMHPASAVFVFQQPLSKRHFGPPGGRSRFVLDVFDVGWENPFNKSREPLHNSRNVMASISLQ